MFGFGLFANPFLLVLTPSLAPLQHFFGIGCFCHLGDRLSQLPAPRSRRLLFRPPLADGRIPRGFTLTGGALERLIEQAGTAVTTADLVRMEVVFADRALDALWPLAGLGDAQLGVAIRAECRFWHGTTNSSKANSPFTLPGGGHEGKGGPALELQHHDFAGS